MRPAFNVTGFAATVVQLCEFIARFALARGLPGPLIVLIWQRVRTARARVEAVLARIEAGTLRRHKGRRKAPPRASARRRPAPSQLPHKRGWLVALVPETAGSGAQLQHWLARPELPALLAAAPQLRRALRPLCHMLGVSLPRPPTPTPPPALVQSGAPSLPPESPDTCPAPPTPPQAHGRAFSPTRRRTSAVRATPHGQRRRGAVGVTRAPAPGR